MRLRTAAATSQNDFDLDLVIAYVDARADLDVIVEEFRALDRLANAAMRRRISRQNADMHSDAVASETQEPFHGCAGKVRAAGRGIDAGTHSGAHGPAASIDEIAVDAGVMVGIFFENREMTSG